MDKQYILAEIRRTAHDNGGKPLGIARFKKATGICRSDWLAKHWRTWADAVTEAGFTPNQLQEPLDEEFLIRNYVQLIRELGHVPTNVDLRMKSKSSSAFPSHTSFHRLGRKHERITKAIEYCQDKCEFADVLTICMAAISHEKHESVESAGTTEEFGFVYLLKSGRFHKIGRTNSAGRREYELVIQLPERAKVVHMIKTDDPVGIEAYWHRRFKERRKNGEWFELSQDEIAAFRRRAFM